MKNRHCFRRRWWAGASFAAVVLAASAPRPAFGGCQCGQSGLEIVFVLDCTSSMKHLIGTVKAQAEKIIHVLEENLGDVRVGLVAFRTASAPDVRFMEESSAPLTSDHKAVAEKIRALRAVGGGLEACDLALQKAVLEMKWTRGRRKVIVLVGDEGPAPEKEREMYASARLAAERGIVINTITVSESAYLYFKNLNPERIAEMERLHGAANVRAGFRHPVFVETAALARGRAVGSGGVRDLVKWTLSFGLSENPRDELDSRTVSEILEWDGPEEKERRPEKTKGKEGTSREAPLIARLRLPGETPVPHDEAALFAHLATRIAMAGPPRMRPLALGDKDLFRHGLLYVSGHGALNFSGEEKTRLKSYLTRGGALLADACCSRTDFDRSFRALMAELFGAGALRALPADHPVFDVAYRIGSVRRAVAHRTARYQDAAPRLDGVHIGGRLAVIYSPDDLGCGWRTGRFARPCRLHDDDALQLSVNAILHALSE